MPGTKFLANMVEPGTKNRGAGSKPIQVGTSYSFV